MEDGYGQISNEEEKQKVFEHYKQTGSWDTLRFKTYEELVKLAGYYDYDYINSLIKELHPDKPLVNIYDDEE
jgi:recombination DNA repair RAD52 pathway protein